MNVVDVNAITLDEIKEFATTVMPYSQYPWWIDTFDNDRFLFAITKQFGISFYQPSMEDGAYTFQTMDEITNETIELLINTTFKMFDKNFKFKKMYSDIDSDGDSTIKLFFDKV